MNSTIENRKARHDYFLLENYEAGIVLLGCEVKSIREGKVNLKDSFARLIKGEVYLFNCHIAPYSHVQSITGIDPIRTRKLLLNRAEIIRIDTKIKGKGTTLVPTKMYFKKGHVKVEIALGQGKKAHDKRETIKRRIHDRETNQAIKSHQRRSR